LVRISPPGRPEKLTNRDKNYIHRQVRINPRLSLRELTNSKFKNINVSKDTVRSILTKKGIGSYKAQRKPMLTIKDRVKRWKWCRQRLHWQIEDWAKVIFSDESNFTVCNRKSQVIVKRLSTEKYHPRYCVPRIQGGGGSLGIWGCISNEGTGCLKCFSGRMNQNLHQDTLENFMIQSSHLFYGAGTPYIYQQDGAPAHTAMSIKNWFIDNEVEVLPWCARSPDLNPIENLWAYIDAKLVPVQITSLTHLEETISKIWNEIPHQLIMNSFNLCLDVFVPVTKPKAAILNIK
jgi:hypothetical protein